MTGVGGVEEKERKVLLIRRANLNNVTSNWLSVEMLFYTKAPVSSSLGFQRGPSPILFQSTHTHTGTQTRTERLTGRREPSRESAESSY